MTRPWAVIASAAFVTVMILGGLAAYPAGTFVLSPSAASVPAHAGASPAAVAVPAPTLGVAESAAATSVHGSAAVFSHTGGGSPTLDRAGGCSVTAAGEASCGAAAAPAGANGPAAVPPAISVASATDPQWYNVTTNLSTHSSGKTPSVYFSGRAAYDPLLHEVVLFDSCPTPSLCPTNQTWTYDGTSWTNLTGTLAHAPSGRQGAMMDYDPALGGVVLFGGVNIGSITLNDTWLFTAAGWNNITSTVGIPKEVGTTPIPGIAWAAMTWDPALDGLVSVDGCVNAGCSNIWGQTWLLTGGAWTYVGFGPGTLTNLTYLAYPALAFDGADGYLVEYGGLAAYTAFDRNYTFTMNSTGVWVNVTNHDATCVAHVCFTPNGRVSDVMTWDSQLNSVFLTDGYNASTATWLNDTWTFSHGAWAPIALSAPAAPQGYCPSAQPALSPWSNNISAFVLGGNGPCGAINFVREWVYETPPQATLTAVPNPLDLGVATTVTAGWAAGTGTGVVAGWNVSYGNGHSVATRTAVGQNSSTAYSQASLYSYGSTGTFAANATWTDYFYLSAKTGISITVDPALVATIVASATTTTAGGSITFSTAPSGGTGTYAYAWSFGDGTTSAVASPAAHVYAKTGTYVVNLTVTDTGGGLVKQTVTITVNAASTGFNLGSTGTYLIIGVVVVVLAILAALLVMRRRKKPASTQPWQAGTPAAGPGAPPPGAGVPPGVGGSPPPPPPPS